MQAFSKATGQCLLIAASLALACHPASTQSAGQPLVTGDRCALWQDSASCAADSADGCAWPDTSPPCQVQPDGGTGSCALGCFKPGAATPDGGEPATCQCASGAYCIEQVGGPATQTTQLPDLSCAVLPRGCLSTDPCTCFDTSEGHCAAAHDVPGLCVCDNGER